MSVPTLRALPGAIAGWLAMITPAFLVVPLARGALTDVFLAAVAAGSFLLFAFTRLDSVWVILAAAAVGLVRAVVVG